MKKAKKTAVVLLMALFLFGCGNVVANGGKNMDENVNKAMDDYQYMTEVLGFSAEELEGVDVLSFCKSFRVREDEMSKDEARQLFEWSKEKKRDDGSNQIYMILSAEGGAPIDSDIEVSKIGYDVNSGTAVYRMVFDVSDKVYYTDDLEAHSMTSEQAESLKTIANRNDIKSWDQITEGSQKNTTGNYNWKLVIQSVDGTYYVYEGDSPDGSTLPTTYSDVVNELNTITENNQ